MTRAEDRHFQASKANARTIQLRIPRRLCLRRRTGPQAHGREDYQLRRSRLGTAGVTFRRRPAGAGGRTVPRRSCSRLRWRRRRIGFAFRMIAIALGLTLVL